MTDHDKLREALAEAQFFKGSNILELTARQWDLIKSAAESTLPCVQDWVIVIARRDGQGRVELFDHLGTRWMDEKTAASRAESHAQQFPFNTYTPVKVPR